MNQKKIGIVFIILFLTVGIVGAAKLVLEVTGKRITVKAYEDEKNPYLYSPRVLALQKKLNAVLHYNLRNYTNIAETGFFNPQTEQALGQFQKMYTEKYHLQKFSAFSAGNDLGYLEKGLNREIPVPAVFFQRNLSASQVKLADPAAYYGNGGMQEVSRIFNGMPGDFVQPATGELNKSFPLYQSPMANDHLLPINLEAKYGSHYPGDVGLGRGWFLTENYSVWYSAEKTNVIIQDGSGISQAFTLSPDALAVLNQGPAVSSNGMLNYVNAALKKAVGLMPKTLVRTKENTDDNYFQGVYLTGWFGESGSQILAVNALGDTLSFECGTIIGGSAGYVLKTVRNRYGSEKRYTYDKEYNLIQIDSYTPTGKLVDRVVIDRDFAKIHAIKRNDSILAAFVYQSTNSGGNLSQIKLERDVQKDTIEFYYETMKVNDLNDPSMLSIKSNLEALIASNAVLIASNTQMKSAVDSYVVGANYPINGQLITMTQVFKDQLSRDYLNNIERYSILQNKLYTEIKEWQSGKYLSQVSLLKSLFQSSTKEYREYTYSRVFINPLLETAQDLLTIDNVLDYSAKNASSKTTNYYEARVTSIANAAGKANFVYADSVSSDTVSAWKVKLGISEGANDRLSVFYQDFRGNPYGFIMNSGAGNQDRKIARIYYPDQSFIQLKYHSNSMITNVVLENNDVYSYEVSYTGNVLKKTLPGNRIYTYEYTNEIAKFLKKPTRIIQPDNTWYAFSYDDNGDLAGQTLYKSNGEKVADLMSTQERLPSIRVEQIDDMLVQSASQKMRLVKDQFGSTTTYEYDEDYYLIKVTYPSTGFIAYERDPFGRIKSENHNNAVTYQYQYNNAGQIIREQKGSFNPVVRTFDADGKLLKETDTLLKNTEYQYNSLGKTSRVIYPDGSQVSYAYDAEGNCTSEINTVSAITYRYDSRRRLVQKTVQDTNAVYTYNYQYNSVGQIVSQSAQGRGFVSTSFAPAGSLKEKYVYSNTYEYDPSGVILEETDWVEGLTKSNRYDSMLHLTHESWNRGNSSYRRKTVWDVLGRKVSIQESLDNQPFYLVSSNQYLSDRSVKSFDRFTNETISFYNDRDQLTNRQLSVFDPVLGQNRLYSSVYSYDPLYNISSETDPEGRTINYTYTAGYLLSTESKKHNAGTVPSVFKTYRYNDAGMVREIIDFNGKSWTKTYQTRGWIESETDPDGHKTSYEYDGEGNRIAQISGNKRVQYWYNSFGKPVKITYPEGMTVESCYDAMGSLSYQKLGDQNPETIGVYQDGKRFYQEKPNGLIIRTAYHPSGRQTEQTLTAADGAARTNAYTYDPQGRLSAEIQPDGTAIQHTYELSQYGLQEETITQGALVNSVVKDQLDRIIRRTTQDSRFTNQNAPFAYYRGTGIISGAVYNRAGDIIQSIQPDGTCRNFLYSASGKLLSATNEIGLVQSLTYDNQDSLRSKTDYDGNTYTFSYNGAGLLSATVEPDGLTTTYTYNSLSGRLSEKTLSSGEKTEYTINSRGMIVLEKNQRNGETSYRYNSAGDIIQETRPDRHSTTYTYYQNGFLASKTTPGTLTTSYTYNGFGETNQIVHPDGGVEHFEYNSMGRVSQRTAFGSVFAYSYSPEGRLSSIQYLDGTMEKHQYSASGMLTNKTLLSIKSGSRSFNYDHNSKGMVTAQSDYTGFSRKFWYDSMGRLTNQSVYAGNECRTTHYSYCYSNKNLVTTSYIQVPGILEYQWSQSVQDFRLNELTRLEKRGGRVVELENRIYAPGGKLTATSIRRSLRNTVQESYQYNSYGDLVQKSSPLGLISSYQYDSSGRIYLRKEGSKETAFSYDGNGRITEEIVMENQIKLAHHLYQYDYRGNRTRDINVFSGLTNIIVYNQKGLKTAEGTLWENNSIKYYTFNSMGNLTAETNETGGTTLYSYDGFGQTISKTRMIGTEPLDTFEISFNSNGKVIREVRSEPDNGEKKIPDSFTNQYYYNAWGELTNQVYPDGSQSFAQYDGAGRKKSETDRYGYISQYTYDSDGGVSKLEQENPGGILSSSFEYDYTGQVTRQNTGDRVEEYRYNGSGALEQVTIQAQEGPHHKTIEYDSFGRKSSESDFNGNKTSYLYDALGRIILVTLPNGSTKRIHYSYDNGLIKVLTTIPNGNDNIVSSQSLDPYGRIVISTSPRGYAETNQYFNLNSGSVVISTDRRGNSTRNTYDAFGRLVETRDPFNNRFLYTYNAFDQVMVKTDKNGNRLYQEYDWKGRLRASQNEQGERNEITYSLIKGPSGQPTPEVSFNSSVKGYDKIELTDPLGNKTTRFEYEKLALAIADAKGSVTRYRYNVNGELIETINAKGSSEKLEYDIRGNLSAKVTANGIRTEYKTDADGRQTEEKSPASTMKIYYDSAGNIAFKQFSDGNSKYFSYDTAGRVISAKEDGSSYRYSYDSEGNLLKRYDEKNNETITYEYDPAGNRTKMMARDKVTVYQYNRNNQLIQQAVMTSAQGALSTNLFVSYAYEAMGLLTNKLYSTGLRVNYEYDRLYHVTRILNTTNGGYYSSFDYTYDRAGNRLTELASSLSMDGNNIDKATNSFVYDEKYQLVNASYSGNLQERYHYDVTGNRLTQEILKGGNLVQRKECVYDLDNRLLAEKIIQGAKTSDIRYDYDRAGRLMKKESLEDGKAEVYGYDARDLMTSYTVLEKGAAVVTRYAYDVENLRTSKTDPDGLIAGGMKKYVYDGQNLLFDGVSFYLNNGSVNGYEAVIKPFRTTAFVKDALGSIRGEIYDHKIQFNSVQNVRSVRLDYSAFGETLGADKTGTNKATVVIQEGLGYTGHYQDNESGLYYARSRFYDPSAGRWTRRDSYNDYGPDGLNKYLYCVNNPVNSVDLLGLTSWNTSAAANNPYFDSFQAKTLDGSYFASTQLALGETIFNGTYQSQMPAIYHSTSVNQIVKTDQTPNNYHYTPSEQFTWEASKYEPQATTPLPLNPRPFNLDDIGIPVTGPNSQPKPDSTVNMDFPTYKPVNLDEIGIPVTGPNSQKKTENEKKPTGPTYGGPAITLPTADQVSSLTYYNLYKAQVDWATRNTESFLKALNMDPKWRVPTVSMPRTTQPLNIGQTSRDMVFTKVTDQRKLSMKYKLKLNGTSTEEDQVKIRAILIDRIIDGIELNEKIDETMKAEGLFRGKLGITKGGNFINPMDWGLTFNMFKKKGAMKSVKELTIFTKSQKIALVDTFVPIIKKAGGLKGIVKASAVDFTLSEIVDIYGFSVGDNSYDLNNIDKTILISSATIKNGAAVVVDTTAVLTGGAIGTILCPGVGTAAGGAIGLIAGFGAAQLFEDNFNDFVTSYTHTSYLIKKDIDRINNFTIYNETKNMLEGQKIIDEMQINIMQKIKMLKFSIDYTLGGMK